MRRRGLPPSIHVRFMIRELVRRTMTTNGA